jgi:hypothetical protein
VAANIRSDGDRLRAIEVVPRPANALEAEKLAVAEKHISRQSTPTLNDNNVEHSHATVDGKGWKLEADAAPAWNSMVPVTASKGPLSAVHEAI